MDAPLEQEPSNEAEQYYSADTTQDPVEADWHRKHRRKTKDLVHRNIFGPRQLLPPARFTLLGVPTSFKSSKTVDWVVPIPARLVPVLINSTIPAGIDDKLMISVDGPDVDGSAYLHILRVWSEDKLIELRMHIPVQDSMGNDEEHQGPQITAITWDDTIDWEAKMTENVTKVKSAKILDIDPNSDQPFTCVPIDGLLWQIDKQWLGAKTEQSTEDLVKYIVLEACRWILRVQLMDRIPEPKCFGNMPEFTYPQVIGGDARMFVPPPAGSNIHRSLRKGDIVKFPED